jgi:hypothetical protein
VWGAQQAGQFFNQNVLPNAQMGAAALQGMAPQFGAQVPNVINAANNPAYAQAGQLAAQTSPQLQGAANTILNQSFDPQGALFNRLQQQQLDQSTVANAMAGLGSSPYGASVASNALGNLDVNWQNQLLNRMTQGGQAAGLLDQAAIANMLTPANAAVVAQLQGAQGLNQLLGGTQSAYAGAGNLLTPAAQGIAQYGVLPYSTYQGLNQDQLGAMQSLLNLGLQGTTLGQQSIGNAAQYMGLGQSAANAAVQAALAQEGMTNAGLMGLGGMGASLLGGSLGGGGGLLGRGLSGLGTGLSGMMGGGFAGIPAGFGSMGTAAGTGLGADAGIMTDLATGVTSDVAPMAFKMSDRRLKTDIKHIGTAANGLKVYSYKLFGRSEIGLMADEVEKVRPWAVITGSDGYKRVNYTLALAA